LARKIKEENGVTGSMMLITFFVTALALLLTIPNIYLDNQIYYKSREIAHLQRVKMTLEEEQSLIKTKLEEIHYEENLLNHDIE
jgi:competence protein ComGC